MCGLSSTIMTVDSGRNDSLFGNDWAAGSVCSVLIGLLLTDIVLGIISRAIPQMNVFMVAQPVQFGFALLLLMLSLPAVVWFIARQIPLTIGVPGGVG